MNILIAAVLCYALYDDWKPKDITTYIAKREYIFIHNFFALWQCHRILPHIFSLCKSAISEASTRENLNCVRW